MKAPIAALVNADMQKVQQAIKWAVYTLLLINFGFYIHEDWNRALHTLTAQSTALQWTSEFATSIDESAWFILLLMFELETYVLEDEDWKGWIAKTVHGARVICFLMIAHTVYAFAVTVADYQLTQPVENATTPCALVDDDMSYVYNLDYTEITAENCETLSTDSAFFKVGKNPVVTDAAGLHLERHLAWADLLEAVIWLLILLLIELVVRLQGSGITGGALIAAATRLKVVLYVALLGLGVYWATLSHWLYLWDELLWIGGFAAIEMNIGEWRDEIVGGYGAEIVAGVTE